jgi:hypothetical protein
MVKEYPDQKQRVAVCYNSWRDAKGIKKEDDNPLTQPEIPKPSGNRQDFVPQESVRSKGYEVPETIDDLEEDHIVKYKERLAKIVKIIN